LPKATRPIPTNDRKNLYQEYKAPPPEDLKLKPELEKKTALLFYLLSNPYSFLLRNYHNQV